MGIFDVFKTKVNKAAEKTGASDDPAAQAPSAGPAATGAEAGTDGQASNMVSEGAPVAQTGEAAPGAGDVAAPQEASSGGMTQSIKDNAARGADKAGEMAEGATGDRYDEKIDSAVQEAKDRLR